MVVWGLPMTVFLPSSMVNASIVNIFYHAMSLRETLKKNAIIDLIL